MKLNSAKLRAVKNVNPEIKTGITRHNLYFILDDVLDTYNVGAVFRLADSTGVKEVLLCGNTETPPNTRIKKSSINTTEWVDWRHFDNTTAAIETLRNEVAGIKIIAVEQSDKSINYIEADYSFPIAIIIGNETHGCSKKTLEAADRIVELPMHGINVSLNTMVSLAIVSYHALSRN